MVEILCDTNNTFERVFCIKSMIAQSEAFLVLVNISQAEPNNDSIF